MHPALRLLCRNLTISINPGYIIWQIVFPLVYIFVVGLAYAALIDGVSLGGREIGYPAFLATGMIGFNIMNATLFSGIIIWNDRRNGMFEQILSGPFTRMHYILANISTVGVIGLASAAVIVVIGYPVYGGSAVLELHSIPMVVFATVAGSVLFGSLATLIATRLRSIEGFNVVLNTVFLFITFVSSGFYPAEGAPEPLRTAFYLNPFTHLVDVIRAGIFGGITEVVIFEMAALAAVAGGLVMAASRQLARMEL